MKEATKVIRIFSLQLLLWTPRIIGIILAVFLVLMSFDVFGHEGFWKTLAALLIHMIPAFIVIILLAFSWKRPWIGGIVFILLGIAFILWTLSEDGHVGTGMVYIPLLLSGILFLLSWFLRKLIEKARETLDQE